MVELRTMSDALRVYLREIRIKKGLSQEKAADAIGWSSRSYNEWETGKNDDIKSRFLIRLVVTLDVPWEDVSYLELNDVSVDEAISIADKRLSSPTIHIPVNDIELRQLTEQLWNDDKLRNAFLIFWSGWKAKELG
jgi:transcriptional regulator with XRE-family HTH domain